MDIDSQATGSEMDEGDPFTPDDAETVQRSIQAHLNSMSTFQKFMMISASITNASLKDAFKAKTQEEKLLALNSEAPVGSPPKDFFIRQLKINFERVLLEQDCTIGDEMRRLERDLDFMFQVISVPQFTFQLDDAEWRSLSKIFARVALDFKLSSYDSLPDKILLDEDEQLIYNCLTDQQS